MPIDLTDATDLQKSQIASGQFIMDGTSYSGADIKAVVHIYRDVNDQLNQKKLELQDLNSTLLSLTSSGSTSSRTLQRISDIRAAIDGKQQEINQLERDSSENYSTKVLAEIQTLSVSTYREKYPVRSLSSTYPKGFTRGPRTVAGSMVFTVFDKNVLYELLEADPSEFDSDRIYSTVIIDQLPPIDITINFANELGQMSKMTILGVEFVSEGQVMSVHDLFIENTVQYIARDIDPMMKIGDNRKMILSPTTVTASSLLREDSSQEYSQSLDPFTKFYNRNTPFK